MFIALIAATVVVVTVFIILRHEGGGSFPWIKFYTKGRECGFSFKEINLLRKVAVENHLENPTSLFWSIKQLDRSIKGMISKLKGRGTYDSETESRFISKLFDFRKNVELNLPKYKLGLKTTRKIDPRQRFKITLAGVGTYSSTLVENLKKYMAISYPEGPKVPPGFSWAGQRINMYFWRQDDAGYVFQSKVIDDYIDRKFPILHITHSDSIIRSQKRNSVRVEVSKPAFLYPLQSIQAANEVEETSRGLKCRLRDLSETGAAVLVGGRAKVGLAVKLQFPLAEALIVMCGVVKGVSFNPAKNQSILHIQAVTPRSQTKNKILSFVYNIFEEREEKPRASKVPSYGS